MMSGMQVKVWREVDHPRDGEGRFRETASAAGLALGDISLTDIADDHARENDIERFEVRDADGVMLGSVHRDGDTPGARWKARGWHGGVTEHDTRERATGALAASEVREGEPFHAAHLRPGDRFRIIGGPDAAFTLEVGWVHRQGDTSLRTVEAAVVKLGNDVRVVRA